MDLQNFFVTVNSGELNKEITNSSELFHHFCNHNYQDKEIEESDIVIFGIPEDRNAQKLDSSKAPTIIRKKLYNLTLNFPGKVQVLDLGNLIPGNTLNDTYWGVHLVVSELIRKNTIPVIIGGSQDLAYGVYLAYEKSNTALSLVTVNPKFDFNFEKDFDYDSYLNKILQDSKTDTSFDYVNIANQAYFLTEKEKEYITNNHWSYYRLGAIKDNIHTTEPFIRNANFLDFDISSVKNSDAPGNPLNSPNGLSAHEACQIANYAGLNESIKTIGLFNYVPEKDISEQTALLFAQMVWYFITGVYSRKGDYPVTDIEHNTKFIVSYKDQEYSITFYKSTKTGRWWMEIPVQNAQENTIIPCSYGDYKKACQEEIPEIWMRFFKKFN